MQLQLFKTMWGFEGDFDKACSEAIEGGFNGIEGRVPEDAEERALWKTTLQKHGLSYIAEIVTGGDYVPRRNATLQEHLHDVEKALQNSQELSPLFATLGLAAYNQSLSNALVELTGSKKKFLPDLLSGKKIGAFGLTEPNAGSDAGGIRTIAKPNADGTAFTLSGQKTFITNGVYGDFLVTVVKTDPEAGTAGFSLLVITQGAVDAATQVVRAAVGLIQFQRRGEVRQRGAVVALGKTCHAPVKEHNGPDKSVGL